MRKQYSIIIASVMILIAAALSGCSQKGNGEEYSIESTADLTQTPALDLITAAPPTPTPEITFAPTAAPESTPEPAQETDASAPTLSPEMIAHNNIDYSSYTPIFVDYCLLAIVDGQKWIDPETLYPFEIYGYEEEYIEVNTSFIGEDGIVYIYNENELIDCVDGIETSYVMYWADGTTGLFMEGDFYAANYYTGGSAKMTTTNPEMAVARKVSLYTDQTSSLYTLDLDGDGTDEQVFCEGYMDEESGTEYYNFVISRGGTTLYEIRREWESDIEEVTEEDIQYCMLNDYGNEYEAMFADVNNDGTYEIIDLTYTYGHHNCSRRIFSCVNGKWQMVGAEYTGD